MKNRNNNHVQKPNFLPVDTFSLFFLMHTNELLRDVNKVHIIHAAIKERTVPYFYNDTFVVVLVYKTIIEAVHIIFWL